jgi:hypothetical protein
LVVAVAFLLRLAYMLRTGGLLQAVQYDDGVYYAAADAFVHGRLPYRDFLFLQPPGVIVAAAPFAWLGTLFGDPAGLIVGRLAFIAVGAASAGLVTVVLRRFGYAAAAFGGFFYAIDYMAVYSERTVLLEPVATLFILLALVFQTREKTRWMVLAGVLLGVSTSFRIWYIVPALVVVLFTSGARRRLGIFLGGVVGTLATYLPFFLADPGSMFREVVIDQTGRNRSDDTLLHKIYLILGDVISPGFGISRRNLAAILLLLAVAAVVVALLDRRSWIYVALLVAGVTVLLLAPSFFPHYTALTNPPLALVVGVAFGRLAGLFRLRSARGTLTAIGVIGLLIVYLPAQLHNTGTPPPARALQAAAAGVDGCIMTDNPSVLPVMNVLSRDLEAGCPLWPDVTGWTYDAASMRVGGVIVHRADNTRWQKAAVDYLTSGAAVIQYRSGTGLTDASKAQLRRGRLLFHDGLWKLYATARSTAGR